MKPEERKIKITREMAQSLARALTEQASGAIPAGLDLWPQLRVELERRLMPERVAVPAGWEEFTVQFEEEMVESNQGWIWLSCYQGYEKEAAEALKAAFAAAGIGDQLVDVIALPRYNVSGGEGILRRAHAMQFSGELLVKAVRTEEAAAVLRSGWNAANSLGLARWQIARTARRSEPERAAAEEYPFKHRERVRVLAWPLAGFSGEVIWVEKKKAQVLVHILGYGTPESAFSAPVNVYLYPDELEIETASRPAAGNEPERAWYVLYSYPGKEGVMRDRLRKRLDDAGLLNRLHDIIIPGQGQDNIALVKDGRVQSISPNQFPGALFVLISMDEAVWNVVRLTPGLTGFVGRGEKPLGYPAAPQAPAAGAAGSPLRAGDRIRILSGLYQNFRAVVIEVDAERSKLRAMVVFYGRPSEAELDFEQVEKE